MRGIIDVTERGVTGDGVTNNTALLRTITKEMTHGGILYFPAGEYVTVSIFLESDTTLYLAPGAVLLGSDDPEDFPLPDHERIPGYTRGTRHGIIAAVNAKNITIEGGGAIDGRGWFWWNREGVFADEFGHRPRCIQPLFCENVKIKDISIRNSPSWTIHPLCCRHVLVSGVNICNPYKSPNTDGINPEGCADVRIVGCSIDVGDDCVTIKAGAEGDPFHVDHPCENITVTGCTMLHGHGGVVIGSEMSGGVRNVVVSGCVFNGTDRGVRIKTRRRRGGVVEDLLFTDIIMKDVQVPFTVNEHYMCGAKPEDEAELFTREARPVDETTPVIRDVTIANIIARGCRCNPMYLLGLPEAKLSGIRVSNFAAEMSNPEGVRRVPVMARNIAKTSEEGLYAENICDSVFENIRLTGVRGAETEFVSCDRVIWNGKEI